MALCSLVLAQLCLTSCDHSPWQGAKLYPASNCCASLVFSTSGMWWYLCAENLWIPGPKQYPNTKFFCNSGDLFLLRGTCWYHLMRQHLIQIESNSSLIVIVVIIMVMTRWPKETRKKKGEMAAVYLEEGWLPGTMGSGQLGGPIVRHHRHHHLHHCCHSLIFSIFIRKGTISFMIAKHWTMLSVCDHRDIRMTSIQVCYVWILGRLISITHTEETMADWTEAFNLLLFLGFAGATRRQASFWQPWCASWSKQEEAEGAAVVALPGRPGEPLLALCALPQLLVHDDEVAVPTAQLPFLVPRIWT